MLEEIAIRFFLGGTIVSLFALIGMLLKPPCFAGIFGSAPSVAIATLGLAFVKEGRSYAAAESGSMVIGALGLVAYSAACGWAVSRPELPVWAAAGICWLTWFAVAFGLWTLVGGGR